jgi:hypothetical protein
LLRKEKIDLREAVSFAEDIIIVLKNIRLNCDTEFHKRCPHKFAIQIYFDPPHETFSITPLNLTL